MNGSVYIVGESPSYESRMLGIKRQLLHLWLAGGLPESIDVSGERCLMLILAASTCARCCVWLAGGGKHLCGCFVAACGGV